jgi:fermentation-respiration switch protein FrsA (DUF1100 family)
MSENILLRIIIYAGIIYLLLNLYAWLVADRLIFVPQAASYTRLPFEHRIATPGGGHITAVYLEHPAPKQTLVFSHGNAEDLGNVVPFMQQFHELGYAVLMYDYRGYGTSSDTPSTRRAKADVLAAYDWLVKEKGVAPENIVAHGRSLGGALAIWLAANRKTGGLIVESSFASAFRVKTRWPLMPWDKFNSVRSIKKADCPVFIMHGVNDEILPFRHAKTLYNAAPEPKSHLWIDDGQHNDYAYVAGDGYLESLQEFLESCRQP